MRRFFVAICHREVDKKYRANEVEQIVVPVVVVSVKNGTNKTRRSDTRDGRNLMLMLTVTSNFFEATNLRVGCRFQVAASI